MNDEPARVSDVLHAGQDQLAITCSTIVLHWPNLDTEEQQVISDAWRAVVDAATHLNETVRMIGELQIFADLDPSAITIPEGN